ncbi:putative RNA-directed DNA polymerase [Tanacetum coccineum]
MIEWIMVCVSTTSYSVYINGDLHGWFNGKRGLRQGDPLSPYLFTLVMEVLTLIVQRRVSATEVFQYHHHCEKQRIVNLCFADDLFLFARGHLDSVSVIMNALEEFKSVSGRVPSIPKSTTFFCNVPIALKSSILNLMPFAEGILPVRYLGVPLISFRLLYQDCRVLVEKLESRVFDWRNKFLSFARRLQLLMRGFLWCQVEMKKGKAKVAWDSVCTPQKEGGLGDVSWGWRKLLQIRHRVRPFIWHKIYNGKSASMWFDRWVDGCPLRDTFTIRNILRSGFSLTDSVSDLISNGYWRWPPDWSTRFPDVVSIPVPDLHESRDDLIVWRDDNGVCHPFSVALAWDSLRVRANVVDWYHVVWFSHCIPRHSIHLWLVIQNKLKTQDRLRQWDVGPSVDLNLLRCPLCSMVPDSHYHLFFDCSFSTQVWTQVQSLSGMDSIPPRMDDILAFLIPISKGRSVLSIIARIVLDATAYFLWMERNSRLFKKKFLTADKLVQAICSTVRLKLITFKFKKIATRSQLLLDRWKPPKKCIFHDGSAG